MYPTSQEYKNALMLKHIEDRVEGIMTLSNGSTYNIDDSNILQGSLSISNAAISSDFNLGSVYTGEMNVTLLDPGTLSRYSLYGAKIELTWYMRTSSFSEEEIPLGVWYVNKPTRSKKTMALQCYDAMTRFDKNITESTTGYAFTLLSYICNKCNVQLGNTKSQIEAMINGDKQLSIDTDTVGTYRDALGYISAALGGFATINRLGKLEIRHFHDIDDAVCPASLRISSTIYDYETYFRSVSANFVSDGKYKEYKAGDFDMDNGVNLSLGNNPLVKGTDAFKQGIIDNIYAQLEDLEYTPVEVEMLSDLSIDLGDLITFEDVNGGEDTVQCIITNYSWTYHSTLNVSGKGDDALLANVKSKTDKQISDIQRELDSKNFAVKTFTNAEAFSIGNTVKEIIKISWSASVATTAILMATIPITLEKDGNVVLTCFKGLLQHYQLTKYLEKGTHFLTFVNYIPSDVSETISYRVTCKAEYFESDSRKQDAKIVSLRQWVNQHDISANLPTDVIDESVPSGSIEALSIRAVVFAQGLNTTAGWDGTFEIAEEFTAIGINDFSVSQLTEAIATAFHNPTRKGVAESFESIAFEFGLQGNLRGAVSFNEKVEQQTVEFTTNAYTKIDDGSIVLNTVYEYFSESETIDSGYAYKLAIETTDKATIESVVITDGN